MVEEKKTTFMWIGVDLQCHRCRKKIKKVLCKFPQIRDQVYNEKQNYVVIKVVCCCPEKVKQKIICKGGDTIKSIEIREFGKETKPPEKERPPEEEKKKKKKKKKEEEEEEKHVTFEFDVPKKPPEEENKEKKKKKHVTFEFDVPKKPPEEENKEKKKKKHVTFEFDVLKKPPEEEEEKDPETVSELPLGPVCVPTRPRGFGTCCTECYEGRGGGPCLYGHGTRPWPPLTPRPRAVPVPLPVPVPVPAYPVGFRTCCTECYEGRDGGPCHYGHGRPPPCYDGYYYGRPIYDSYGGGHRSCYTYVSRCEETSPECTIT
ncbi:hypothetical protein CMV_012046 [Castanea mollissima]|uniref:Uncharacterized protein n=1 Tax=Castanea mollissima TaxID=60419 RepID=A0A8J4R454_9ROSI|nr:hypothetical protein CMV_012046 [Castanea mollissima]